MRRIIFIVACLLTVSVLFAAFTEKQKVARSLVFKALGEKKITAEELNSYLKQIENGDTEADAVAAKISAAPAKKTVKNMSIGWRYDGSGIFKDATPPLEWAKGPGQNKNILWTTLIPSQGPSSVIVVGENIYFCGGNFDLLCFDKKKGKLLWMKQFSPYEAFTTEERTKWPAEMKKLDGLAADRDRIMKAFPSVLSDDIEKKIKEKNDIEKEMQKIFYAVDADRFPMSQEVGFATATPASDGQNIYVWNALGITASFTFEGKMNWIRNSRIGKAGQEHGYHSSPLVLGGKVIFNMKDYYALDAATGNPAWTLKFWDWGTFASPVPLKVGGVDCFMTGDGGIARVSDGKIVCKGKISHSSATPVIGDGHVMSLWSLLWSDASKAIQYYKLPVSADPNFTPQMKYKELPVIDKPFKETNNRTFPSAVAYNGLFYFATCLGEFYCFDIEKGEYVYKTMLDTEDIDNTGARPYTCGILASLCLVGENIFLTTNTGMTLVIPAGREFKIKAKNRILQLVDRSYRKNIPEGFISSAFFDGNQIFFRGEKYLYCIGEPGKPFAD